MSKHEFLLPDELGWECNDELQKYIDAWLKKSVKYAGKIPMDIIKAELIDDMYAIIKKYQEKKND